MKVIIVVNNETWYFWIWRAPSPSQSTLAPDRYSAPKTATAPARSSDYGACKRQPSVQARHAWRHCPDGTWAKSKRGTLMSDGYSVTDVGPKLMLR